MPRHSQLKRVLAFDPQLVAREGLTKLLSRSPFQLIGVENDLDQFLDRIQNVPADALLVEPISRGMRDWVAIERIFDCRRDARVLIYSAAESPSSIAAAYQTGVLGVVTKQSDRDTLMEALLAVCGGKKYFMSEFKDQLLDHLTSPIYLINPKRSLHARDVAIFSMLAEGQKPSAVANAIGMTPKYVQNRSATIAKQLGIGREDFAKVAKAHALIPEAI